jgi:hypothetical protein
LRDVILNMLLGMPIQYFIVNKNYYLCLILIYSYRNENKDIQEYNFRDTKNIIFTVIELSANQLDWWKYSVTSYMYVVYLLVN